MAVEEGYWTRAAEEQHSCGQLSPAQKWARSWEVNIYSDLLPMLPLAKLFRGQKARESFDRAPKCQPSRTWTIEQKEGVRIWWSKLGIFTIFKTSVENDKFCWKALRNVKINGQMDILCSWIVVGWIVSPQNSYVEDLSNSTSECEYIWG